MVKKHSSFDYEMLARFMLPSGILDYYEITKIEEEITDEKDETDTVVRILHIFLDERDLRFVTWHDLQPNGFTEPRLFNDFPQREHKRALEYRRDDVTPRPVHLPLQQGRTLQEGYAHRRRQEYDCSRGDEAIRAFFFAPLQ